jgi:tetratricopeptide (TPR) repeat protein
VAFTGDGKTLAFTPAPSIVQLAAPGNGPPFATIQGPDTDSVADVLIFTPDGSRLLLVKGGPSRCQVWDLRRIRARLAEIGLDWSPPLAPSCRAETPVVRVEIDLGDLDVPVRSQHHEAQARAHEKARAWDKAVGEWSRLVELQPKQASAWNNRGVAYFRQGRYEEARADFTAAIALRPTDATPWANRGNVYDRLGQHDEAVADYSRAIALKPKDAALWRCRAKAHLKRGDHGQAIADFKEELKRGRSSVETHADLAWLLANCPEPKLRHPAEAVKLAREAVRRDGKSAKYWSILGAAHYRAGMTRQRWRR